MMVMERSGQHAEECVPEGKRVADGAGVYFYLFLCLFAACFFPPVRGFSEEWLRPKWVLAEAVGLLVLLTFGIQVLVACRHRGSGRRAFGWWGRVEDAFCEALVGVAFLEAVYAIVRMFRGGQEGMAASGTFDNPAGLAFCLCAALPFHACLWRWCPGRLWFRSALAVCALVILTAILCTGSRTGWICLALYAALWLQKQWQGHRMMKLTILAVLAVGLAWGISVVKTDSTNGRRFILERSWELVQARPFAGYGSGGFLREYMPRQADYFKAHADSGHAWLASEVYHPLNEFVWVWIEFGLPGVLLSLGALAWLLSGLFRRRDIFSRMLAVSLCACVVFALFSYPLKYPLASVIGIAAVERMCSGMLGRGRMNGKCWRWAGMAGIVVAVVALIKVSVAYSYEYEWSRVARQALRGHSREMMPRYAELYGHYRHDASFLYNYAAEQFYAGRYEEALSTAKECRALWPSYNLSLLTGDICRAAGKYGEAVRHYEQAHWMCPVRFAPLEGLYYAYKSGRQPDKADSVADVVARKRIKVDSPDVRRIKKEILEDVRHGEKTVSRDGMMKKL
ncbi:O-antigen ligase family protein [Paraprevotella xylaniphila]